MESGEVLDLGETRQVAARTARVIRFETPTSGERGAVGAHKSTKKTLYVPAIVNLALQPHMQITKLITRDDCWRLS